MQASAKTGKRLGRVGLQLDESDTVNVSGAPLHVMHTLSGSLPGGFGWGMGFAGGDDADQKKKAADVAGLTTGIYRRMGLSLGDLFEEKTVGALCVDGASAMRSTPKFEGPVGNPTGENVIAILNRAQTTKMKHQTLNFH